MLRCTCDAQHRFDAVNCFQVIGLTCALGSGLPIGKEGPFVHIGTCIASLLTKIPAFSRIARHESLMVAALSAGVAVRSAVLAVWCDSVCCRWGSQLPLGLQSAVCCLLSRCADAPVSCAANCLSELAYLWGSGYPDLLPGVQLLGFLLCVLLWRILLSDRQSLDFL